MLSMTLDLLYITVDAMDAVDAVDIVIDLVEKTWLLEHFIVGN
jgi:hypothetical protein